MLSIQKFPKGVIYIYRLFFIRGGFYVENLREYSSFSNGRCHDF